MAILKGDEARAWLAANPNRAFTDMTSGQRYMGAQPTQFQSPSGILGLILNLTKPLRQGVGIMGEFGGTISDLVKTAQGRESEVGEDIFRKMGSIYLTEQEKQQLKEDPLKMGIKSGVGLMSYAIPGGAAKGATSVGSKIGTAALRGGAAGTLGGFSYSPEGQELESTLKGAGLGALMGGALQGVGEGVKAIRSAKLSNKLDDMAEELRASALKKDIGIAPTTKQGKNILPRQVIETSNKMGLKVKSPEDLKAFSKTLYESNSNIANQAAQQLDSMGVMVDIQPIKQPLLEQLAKTKSPELQAPIQKVIDSIDSATGGSNTISTGDLLNLRREWGKLGNWNPFMDASATTTANGFEAAYLRANDVLDDAFKNAGVTGFKEANKALSLSIDADNWAERAIANKSSRPLWNDMTQDAAIAATVFGGGGPGAVAGAVGSKVAQRYAEPIAAKALEGASNVVSGASRLPNVLQPLISGGQRAIPAVAGMAGGQQMQQPVQSQQQLPQGVDSQGLSALNLMLAQEILNGNISAAEANAVLSLLGMGGAGDSLTANQSKAQALQSSLDKLRSIWEGSGGGTRLMETLGINIGTGARSLDQAKASVAEDLGRLQSQGVISPTEREEFDRMMPNSWDSPEIVEQKFAAIQDRINSY